MRGKRGFPCSSRRGARLIPAYAGKTLRTKRGHQKRWAHPRVCGENSERCELSCVRSGSSPRMRGKQDREALTGGESGLIPAYAGKTVATVSNMVERRAHPRVCGENFVVPGRVGAVDGSSPRMRGKPCLWSWSTVFRGLIPAYAGKTSSATCTPPPVGAHPRVCGENVVEWGLSVFGVGSSPRMRGKR